MRDQGLTLGKTGGVCSVFAKARRLPVNVNGEFERNTKIVAENFDTKKPQTELTEWGYCGKLQRPNGYTQLGWLLTYWDSCCLWCFNALVESCYSGREGLVNHA